MKGSLRNALLTLTLLAWPACGGDTGPSGPTRAFRMGFSSFPPNFNDPSIVLPAINFWTPRADAALFHVSPPWAAMIAGYPPAQAVDTVEMPLVNYYRGKGLDIVFTVDATDGLNRSAEAPALVAAGRSVTDTAIQRMYRQWVFAVADKIRPSYLGLVAETNLIRASAPDSVYDALVVMANAVAAQIRAAGIPTKLYVSIQVETAWGALAGPSGPFVGIAQDRTDFPFVDAIGLSSYPYLGGYADPENLPSDYYSRIVLGTTLPVLVVEGGWPSISVAGVSSSPAEQSRYIRRQVELLSAAGGVGLFQITFYDIDLTGFPPQPPGSPIGLFTHLGLADSAMNPKPVLGVWDSVYAVPYRP